ncbi:Elongation of very long chain fatty acids protein 6 [Melipona quadrifasciata]|uniref:Elongation of very long chain fatty acids protein n=1 Tax=Melipona quadrifasciata TaxID=166423 RepID=A0A0M8ZRW5_9HYME|nr:Elongation of very long chain fatty acids protein 6 [Melipona quadrifasciata]
MNVQLHHMDRVQVALPTYPCVFNFEKNFVYSDTQAWMRDHFPNCFYYCAIYILLIFGGRYYMSNRRKFEIRGMLILWNITLALLSIFCNFRVMPELYHVLSHDGYYHSVCIPRYLTHNPISAFWSWIFTLMKLLEFGDTVFIVLRKQSLIFLHWYHHVTVLLYGWFSYVETSGSSIWFGTVNAFIHSCMYCYYALRAMRYNPPKWIAMTLTTLQIAQMILGIIITVSIYYYVQIAQLQCNVTLSNLKISALMYISYLVLFVNYFKQTYLSDRIGKKNQFQSVSSTKTD